MTHLSHLNTLSFAPIFWEEGMMLMQHHFQQHDLVWQRYFAHHIAHLMPYFWGLRSLDWDHESLASGIFRLKNFVGIFQDGTPLVFNQEFELSIKIPLQEQDSVLYVYACLPPLTATLWDRYERVDETVSDRANAHVNHSLSFLRPKIFLKIHNQPPEALALPLICLRWTKGSYVLDEHYIPPFTHIVSSCRLHHDLEQSIQRMRMAIREGAFLWKEHSLYDQEIHKLQEMVRIMAEYVLTLEVMLSAQQTMSYLYDTLLRLTGALSVTRGDPITYRATPYHPMHFNDIFTPLLRVLDDSLNFMDRFRHAIPFHRHDQHTFVYKNGVNAQEMILGMDFANDMPTDSIKHWIQHCVIATQSFVDKCRDGRTLGALRTILEPHERPLWFGPEERVCVSVQTHGNFCKKGEPLWIYHPKEGAQGVVFYELMNYDKEKNIQQSSISVS